MDVVGLTSIKQQIIHSYRHNPNCLPRCGANFLPYTFFTEISVGTFK